MKKPILQEIKTLYKTRFMKLHEFLYDNGVRYFVFTRNEKDKTIALLNKKKESLKPDAVTCALCIQEEGEEDKMLLFYEYRYPIGQFVLSVPSGLCEDESIYESVKREIKEECGLIVNEKEITMVNPLLFSTPGFSDESTAFVKINVKIDKPLIVDNHNTVGNELIKEYFLVTKEEAKVILQKGIDRDGNYYSIATWVALSIFVNM